MYSTFRVCSCGGGVRTAAAVETQYVDNIWFRSIARIIQPGTAGRGSLLERTSIVKFR